MGMGMYAKLEHPVLGIDPLAIDGKALLAEFFHSLEADGDESPFLPISRLFNLNPQDAVAFAAGEGIDAELGEATWCDPREGVEAVRSTLARLREENPNSQAIQDLKRIEAVLVAADKQRVRFYLTCDMP
jgi:hypothetical protein